MTGPSEQGWSAVEDTLKLSGWDKSRRVVILRLRRAVKTDLALSRKTKNDPGEQIELLMPDKDVQAWSMRCWFQTAPTHWTLSVNSIGTVPIARTALMSSKISGGGEALQPRTLSVARPVPAPWRSCTTGGAGICRAAKPGARMDAITSRALLLAGPRCRSSG